MNNFSIKILLSSGSHNDDSFKSLLIVDIAISINIVSPNTNTVFKLILLG